MDMHSMQSPMSQLHQPTVMHILSQQYPIQIQLHQCMSSWIGGSIGCLSAMSDQLFRLFVVSQ